MLLFNTCIHTYMHAQLTHTGLYVDVIAKELALSEATWCYWISVFSIAYLAGNQSLVLNLPHTTCSAPILHHLFSLSCFPHAIFTFLLLLAGRSWHVGLSGPLFFFKCSPLQWNNNSTTSTTSASSQVLGSSCARTPTKFAGDSIRRRLPTSLPWLQYVAMVLLCCSVATNPNLATY